MKRKTPITFLPVLAAGLIWAQACVAGTIFYNGDPDLGGSNGGNFLDCSSCRGSDVRVYDNFSLSGAATVTGLFGSWELLAAGDLNVPVSAEWEIRTGLAQGDSGTLVASGTGALSTVLISTPNGGNSNFSTYFTGSVSGLTVSLGPGTYWMEISPFLANFDETFLLGANGANGVHAAIDGQSFVSGPYWSGMQSVGGYLQQFTQRSTYDFSYGAVSAQASTPEPGSLALAGLGAMLVGLGRRKRRR